MKRSLVLGTLLIATSAIADALLRIEYQRSDNGQYTWSTFGTETFGLYSSNAPVGYFNGFAQTASNTNGDGTKNGTFVFLSGTNILGITNIFLSVSNFPFVGETNTVYRPNLSIITTNVIDYTNFDGGGDDGTNNPPPIP